MTRRCTWLWWALAFAVGLAMWVAIYDLFGAFVVLGILAFAICAFAVAAESMRAQAEHGRRKDEEP